MLTAIAQQYPFICQALRRAYGVTPDYAAAMIMAARYGGRANVWLMCTPSKARAMISDAIGARYRNAKSY